MSNLIYACTEFDELWNQVIPVAILLSRTLIYKLLIKNTDVQCPSEPTSKNSREGLTCLIIYACLKFATNSQINYPFCWNIFQGIKTAVFTHYKNWVFLDPVNKWGKVNQGTIILQWSEISLGQSVSSCKLKWVFMLLGFLLIYDLQILLVLSICLNQW